eukprot:364111-Chlamydomonas_euryale.AAC.9
MDGQELGQWHEAIAWGPQEGSRHVCCRYTQSTSTSVGIRALGEKHQSLMHDAKHVTQPHRTTNASTTHCCIPRLCYVQCALS